MLNTDYCIKKCDKLDIRPTASGRNKRLYCAMDETRQILGTYKKSIGYTFYQENEIPTRCIYKLEMIFQEEESPIRDIESELRMIHAGKKVEIEIL
jgi:hypothetical protein